MIVKLRNVRNTSKVFFYLRIAAIGTNQVAAHADRQKETRVALLTKSKISSKFNETVTVARHGRIESVVEASGGTISTILNRVSTQHCCASSLWILKHDWKRSLNTKQETECPSEDIEIAGISVRENCGFFR